MKAAWPTNLGHLPLENQVVQKNSITREDLNSAFPTSADKTQFSNIFDTTIEKATKQASGCKSLAYRVLKHLGIPTRSTKNKRTVDYEALTEKAHLCVFLNIKFQSVVAQSNLALAEAPPPPPSNNTGPGQGQQPAATATRTLPVYNIQT